MRISGLASGFDTDEMVRNLMNVERLKVSRYEQQKQLAIWKQERYDDINKDFANFILNSRKELGLNSVSSTGGIKTNSYKNLDYLKKAVSSKEGAASVRATANAVDSNFKIDIKSVATGASFVSDEINPEALKGKSEVSFTINGFDIEVKRQGDKDITMNDIVRAINNATKEETVDGKTVTSKLDISASYDQKNKRLFLQTRETGKDSSIVIGGRDQEFFPGKSTEGSDAKIVYNGIELEYSSNLIEINGVEISLNGVEDNVNISVGTDVDEIVSRISKLVDDYNKILDKASLLVGEKRYPGFHPLSAEEKKAMTEEDVKLWEEKAKSGMLNKDETINRMTQNIRNVLYEKVDTEGPFKQIFELGITTDKYSKGAAGGRLVIDEDKLRNAISQDAEGVMELLFKEGKKVNKPGKDASDEEKAKYQEYLDGVKKNGSVDGVFSKVYDQMIEGMKGIIEKSGPGENSALFRDVRSNILMDFVTSKGSVSELDKRVKEMDRKIDDLNILLGKKEDAYYAKFTAMEKYIYKMNSQSNWIGNQLMR